MQKRLAEELGVDPAGRSTGTARARLDYPCDLRPAHDFRKTADHHVQHIYAKIGGSSRGAAALYATQHGLLAADA